MLLRHAKSDRANADVADHDRKLNERGRAAASAVGAYLVAEELTPALVLCSTATRTRETCDYLVADFGQRPSIRYERRLYLATPEAIINIVAALPNSIRSVLVIGHNPGLHFAAQAIASAGKAKARTRLHEKFPTAALAVIDFETTDWRDVKACNGRLERFVKPKEIMQIT